VPYKTPNWASIDASEYPKLVTDEVPGPTSRAMHARAAEIMKGYSGQVRLFPVCFESGKGVVLRDVDSNEYIDFSSGIYVTNLGHCHPKVSEAVAKAARTLMNCHDFTTPGKLALLETLVEVLPGDLSGVQLYDSGTTAVEAALRVARASTGKHEFISCFRDFHGKSGHAVSLARMKPVNGPARATGFYMVPRADPYRPLFTRPDGTIDTDRYLDLYDEFIAEATTGQVAAFVLEPIQGWAGSIFPPDDFLEKLVDFCHARGILFIADEVLTGMGRTGTWLACEHYGVVPDVVTIGKGFGNGFPVTAMITRSEHKGSVETISASTSYGGNPMACAAALASIEVIQEEGILDHVADLERFFVPRLERMKAEHPIVGDVRCKGCLMGVELVKDRATREPFTTAGEMVYRKAFQKGLAWIPAGHILRMSPPLIMEEPVAAKAMDLIDEAIGETEKELLE